MNDWMIGGTGSGTTSYQPDRGKVLDADQLEKMESFHRYLDIDGDGMSHTAHCRVHTPRVLTLPGVPGHNMFGKYTESAERVSAGRRSIAPQMGDGQDLCAWHRLSTTARKTCIGILSVGSCDGAIQEARRQPGGQGGVIQLSPHTRLPVQRRRTEIPRCT